MTNVTNNRIIEEIAYMRNATAPKLAAEFNMTRQGMDKRLRKLEQNRVVASEKVGNTTVWSRSDDVRGDTSVETAGLSAQVRQGSDFTVDIQPDLDGDIEDVELLVQAGPDGYQMDVWWEDDSTRRQASNWVNFGKADMNYPYDNRHPRRPMLSVGGEDDGVGVLSIHDPEPRVPEMGFDGADISLEWGEKEGVSGFYATLTWTDDHAEEHKNTSFLPLIDPREDKETFVNLAYA